MKSSPTRTVIFISFVFALVFLPFSAAYLNQPASANLTKNLRDQTVVSTAKTGLTTYASMDNADQSNAFISVVQSGTTNESTITVTSNPIGKSIEVDIRIDDVSTGFWAWSLTKVSWNPAVMQLTNVQEGSFLADNTGASALFIGDSSSLWNNTGGYVEGGLSEALSEATTSVDSSGILATLTFKITNYGNSSVTVSGAYTVANFSEASSGSCPHTAIASNNARIIVLSAGSSAPDFPSWIIASLVIAPLFGALAYVLKKKRPKTPSSKSLLRSV